jgi:hypothetical protein
LPVFRTPPRTGAASPKKFTQKVETHPSTNRQRPLFDGCLHA